MNYLLREVTLEDQDKILADTQNSNDAHMKRKVHAFFGHPEDEEQKTEKGYTKQEWEESPNWNGYQYSDIAVQNITNLYLYGQATPPVNVEDRVRGGRKYEKNWIVKYV